jgi:hypothetical protein
MNIFALSPIPSVAAKFHCDNHINKMLIESAQMLSTTWHVMAPDDVKINQAGDWCIASTGNKIYKPYQPNHPCNKWVRECRENYLWLVTLAHYLGEQFKVRFGKPHGTSRIVSHLRYPPNQLPLSGSNMITPFAQVMPEEYQKLNDPVTAYRNYYRAEKAYFATWTNIEVPYWFIQE